MHGELMEFNESLQRQLMSRESQLRRLTEEVTSLRGPVRVFCSPFYFYILRYVCILYGLSIYTN